MPLILKEMTTLGTFNSEVMVFWYSVLKFVARVLREML